MACISILAISERSEPRKDPVKIVEEAVKYFPDETWDEIRFLGKLSLEHDVKIAANGTSHGAYLLRKLLSKIQKMRNHDALMNLLLGITPHPLLAIYCFFDGKHFKRTPLLVNDYVAQEVGVISLFRNSTRASTKVVAHGLGHSKGLRHHAEPIDLMHSQLLSIPALQVEGFCRVCVEKLTKDRF